MEGKERGRESREEGEGKWAGGYIQVLRRIEGRGR